MRYLHVVSLLASVSFSSLLLFPQGLGRGSYHHASWRKELQLLGQARRLHLVCHPALLDFPQRSLSAERVPLFDASSRGPTFHLPHHRCRFSASQVGVVVLMQLDFVLCHHCDSGNLRASLASASAASPSLHSPLGSVLSDLHAL